MNRLAILAFIVLLLLVPTYSVRQSTNVSVFNRSPSDTSQPFEVSSSNMYLVTEGLETEAEYGRKVDMALADLDSINLTAYSTRENAYVALYRFVAEIQTTGKNTYRIKAQKRDFSQWPNDVWVDVESYLITNDSIDVRYPARDTGAIFAGVFETEGGINPFAANKIYVHGVGIRAEITQAELDAGLADFRNWDGTNKITPPAGTAQEPMKFYNLSAEQREQLKNKEIKLSDQTPVQQIQFAKLENLVTGARYSKAGRITRGTLQFGTQSPVVLYTLNSSVLTNQFLFSIAQTFPSSAPMLAKIQGYVQQWGTGDYVFADEVTPSDGSKAYVVQGTLRIVFDEPQEKCSTIVSCLSQLNRKLAEQLLAPVPEPVPPAKGTPVPEREKGK